MYFVIYTFLGWLLTLTALPVFLAWSLATGRHREGLRERLGLLPDFPLRHDRPTLWLHASSVGEVKAVKSLVNAAEEQKIEANFILTVVTPQGRYMAEKELGDKMPVVFAPIDLPWVVKRFATRLAPALYVCLETELWPGLIHCLHQRGTTLVLLNGRISERSYRGYLRFKGFFSSVLRCFSTISTIQDIDRKRFIGLGAPKAKVETNGNIKYDLGPDYPDAGTRRETVARLREKLSISGETVIVAGSTHGGEEEQILDAWASFSDAAGNKALLILAPRHLERLDEVERIVTGRGIACQRYGGLKTADRTANCILVDCMGELAALYAIADFAFCGGSLVERGGHNIMEAAVWGKAPFYGPSMKDFADACTLVEDKNAAYPVQNAAMLAEQLLHCRSHRQEYEAACRRAESIAARQQGAAAKQVQLIKNALQA